MSDLLRMTGMYSGMDTESIIAQLVSTKSKKVTDLKNDQKKLEWKQTAWQDLNSKVYNLYSKTLSKLRLSSAYKKKKTTSSDPTKATVVAGDGATDGTQSLKVEQIAKAGYLTGAKLAPVKTEVVKDKDGKTVYDENGNPKTKKVDWKLTDKISEIDSSLIGKTLTVTTGKGDNAKTTEVEITEDMTFGQFTSKLSEAGVKANFDVNNQRFFVSASATGADNDFSISATGMTTLAKLGLGSSMTGAKVQSATNLKTTSKLSDVNPGWVGKKITVTTGKGDNAKTTEIEIAADTTIARLVNKLTDAGIKTSFDVNSQSFSLASATTDDFTIEGTGDILEGLGLDETLSAVSKTSATKTAGEDSRIILNGAEFTSSSNAYNINGLTVNATGVTDGEITITTSTDYDGVYDTIKDFISEYNELINEMDKLYNAESARKYSMLTDEEKEAMSDEEVEKWEDTIKGSLLRKDSTLSSLMNSMVNTMMKGFEIEVNGEKKTKYLYDYGIKTLSYFDAEDNEHHAYHIDGNTDDESTGTKEDKLKAALASDPEETAEFFATLCKELYSSIDKAMNTDRRYSSVYKVYNDKQLKTEYDSYTKKIKDAEKALNDYEDKWYKKFSAMEVALSKLQSNTNAVTSMLGTG